MSDMLDWDPVPLLVMLHFQKEFITPGRRYEISHSAPVISAAKALLNAWRGQRLPILHIMRVQASHWFNRAAPFSDWIDDLRPQPAELLFESNQVSAYTSEDVRRYIHEIRSPMIVLAGMTLNEAVMSFTIEAGSRGHNVLLAEDAVGIADVDGVQGEDVKRVLLDALKKFARVETAKSLIERINHLAYREPHV